MRELPLYREELEALNVAFPARAHLTIRDVASYFGSSVNTAKKNYPFIKKDKSGSGCTKQQLARAIAERKRQC